MKIWMKIAAGVIGGIAIIASLGGFSNTEKNTNTNIPEEELPDDILDGNNTYEQPRRKSERVRRETEQGVRNLQEGLTRASNVLGHISIICNSVVRMFYEDPCIHVTPTTLIM